MVYNYENFMHISKLLNINDKYYTVKEEDITEIRDVIDYAEGLIIKDQDKAMETETVYSNKQASIYISAVMDTGNDLSEFDRQMIMDRYIENNPYYIQLKEEYGIPYLEARMAKDYTILKATKNSLSPNDKILFESCYQYTIDYFIRILNNKAFIGEPLNKCYFRDVIVFFTVQKYITRKMERYFDPMLYTEYECKNTFISYGIDYFDKLPLEYKRKLICSLNSIIKYKGTDKCLEMILEAFGIDNIRIYKYMVAKDQKKNELIAYKVPLTEEVNTESDPVVDFHTITSKDALWQCTDEEILEHEFNVVNTKYISVNIAVDILKSTYNLSYAISILDYLEREFIDNTNKGDFSITYKTISNDPIYIYDILIAIIIMTYRKNNVPLTINNGSEHRVNGFNLQPMDIECRRIIRDIQLNLIKNRKSNISNSKYIELYDFFVGFDLMNFSNKNLYSELELRNIYDKDPDLYRQQIANIATKYHFNNIITKLKENKDIGYLLLDILEFYSGVIALNMLDILYVKERYNELYLLLCKYNIYSYRNEDPVVERLSKAFFNDMEARKELKEYILRQDNNSLNRMYEENDLEGLLSAIKIISERKRDELITIMSISDMNEKLAKDNTDILYYKRTNAYFELFTKFYVSKSVTYNLNDIGKIFSYNKGLRDKLDEYISECDNIDLYKSYMALWDKVFMVNTSKGYLNGYSTWSDLLKDRNLDLYNYTTPPVSLDTKAKTKEWQNQTLFELCEVIDLYFNINSSIFSESNFIGAQQFISKFVKIVVMLFKAYTIDLTAGVDSFIYDSKRESTIKLIDEININTLRDAEIEHLDIEDFCYFEVRDWPAAKEKIELSDSVTIRLIETMYKTLCTLDGSFNTIAISKTGTEDATHKFMEFDESSAKELMKKLGLIGELSEYFEIIKAQENKVIEVK